MTTIDSLNYEEDIRIDHTALDVEWVRQPELMGRYAKHAVEARRAFDDAKERLDVGKAKLEFSIRANPTAYGLEKITESAIQSVILQESVYGDLTRVFAEARYEHEVALAAVRAVDQRKSALENLVRLLGMSYFAGPQVPRDLSEEFRRGVREREQRLQNAKVRMGRRRTRSAE